MEHNWQQLITDDNKVLPKHIVKASDSNEFAEAILVGRAYLDDEPVPATVVPSRQCAYVSKNGKAYVTNKYEVLVGRHYYWQACEEGYFPANAADFGTDKQLFIGRVYYEETVHVGRVDPTQGVIYFGYNGQEVCLKSYDVLTFDDSACWVSNSFNNIPSDAVVGGYDYRNNIIYIGRSLVNSQWIPTKIIPSEKEALACTASYDIPVSDYQILCGSNYTWQKVYNQYIPPNTKTTGTTSRGEHWYVARGDCMEYPTPGLVSPDKRYIYCHYYSKLRDYQVLVEEL